MPWRCNATSGPPVTPLNSPLLFNSDVLLEEAGRAIGRAMKGRKSALLRFLRPLIIRREYSRVSDAPCCWPAAGVPTQPAFRLANASCFLKLRNTWIPRPAARRDGGRRRRAEPNDFELAFIRTQGRFPERQRRGRLRRAISNLAEAGRALDLSKDAKRAARPGAEEYRCWQNRQAQGSL